MSIGAIDAPAAWMAGGRSRTSICRRPPVSATARSSAFSSSRTLPGQLCDIRCRSASWEMLSAGRAADPALARVARARRASPNLLQEMLHEQRHVVLAIAQRRHVHGNHGEPVEQILAERALGHHPCQVVLVAAMMRTSTLTTPGVAEALHLAALDDAQQLHLQRRRHGADFVEEERAAVGFLEAAGAAWPRRR